MPESQKKIYCVAGKDEETISKMPQMELMRERGIEVIYLTDPVDEFAVEALQKYDDKEIQSITRENFELDDEEFKKEKTEVEELGKTNEQLLKDVKEAIGEDIFEVRLTSLLKSGAVCLTTSAAGPSLNMEKTFAQMNNPFFKAMRILEINPNHALFKKLVDVHAGGKDSAEFKDFCNLLYAQALLIEGILPPNPVEFAEKIAALMAK